MDNIQDILKGIIPSAKELTLPEQVPQDEQLVHLAKRTLLAVLEQPNVSSADAPLIEALLAVRNSFTEY